MTSYGEWREVYTNNINESGKVVGFATDGAIRFQAIAWSDPGSAPVALQPLPGHADSWAGDVNARGTVCGASGALFVSDWRAVTWDNRGNVTDRHPSGWTWSDMWSLNDSGDGAGEVYDDYWNSFACYWPAAGQPVVLDTPAAYMWSWALSINKDGLMAGDAWPNGAWYYPHACYWDGPGGALVDIHDLVADAVGEDLQWSQGYEATDKGEIVGFCLTADWDVVPFAYTEEGGVTLLDSAGESQALAWQSAGRYVVGAVGGTSWFAGDPDPAVWERGTKKGEVTWTLHRLTGLTGYETIAGGVNEAGNVVGVARAADGAIRPWYAKRAGK